MVKTDRALLRFELTFSEDPAPLPGGRRAGVWTDPSGGVCGQSWIDGPTRWIWWQRAGLFRCASDALAVQTWGADGVDRAEVSRLFRREVEPLMLQARGWEALHGSAVAGARGAVAFCGTSGSGKSTMAYALSRRGRRHLADDHLVLSVDDDRVHLCPRSFEASLRPLSAMHFGSPNISAREDHAEEPVRLSALVLLSQSVSLPSDYAIDQVEPAAAFAEVLPHAHCFDPADPVETARLTDHYLTLCDIVPVYRVLYRPSFDRIEPLLDAVQALG